MDVSEYIDAVTGQMRCKRARGMVAKELSDHISDQMESYVKEGMDPEAAASEAVRQMGDAVEVGMEMDRLHRPRLDKKVLVAVGIFSLAAIFFQTMIVQALRAANINDMSSKMVPLQVLFGVLLMVAILYLDYTILGKHPVILWVVLVCLPWVWNVSRINWYGDRVCMYVFMGLMLPAYVGIVYHYRKKGWLGLLCSLFWLLAGVFVYLQEMNRTFLGLLVGFSGVLLLSYALAKGWYGIPKVPSLAALWGGMLGALALFLLAVSRTSYMLARIEAFLNYGADTMGSGYMTAFMRERMEGLSLWGQGEWLSLWKGRPVEAALSFFMILNEMGIIPAILIVIGFIVLFAFMAKGVSRQKNVLGSLLGMACVLGLVIPAVGHLLSNLSLVPYTDVYIPFLYPGWVANAASYTLLGLYLSVYRNTDVVA